jgi:hypothetical protein
MIDMHTQNCCKRVTAFKIVARLSDDPDETWTTMELGWSVPKQGTIHSVVK